MKRYVAAAVTVWAASCGGPPPERCSSEAAPALPVTFSPGRACLVGGRCVEAVTARAAPPSSRQRVRIAFVAEGFREDQLDVFRAHVAKLVDDGLRAGGLLTRLDDRLEVLRVDMPSQTDSVTDARHDDTAFGGCLQGDAMLSEGEPFSWNERHTPGLFEALLPGGADAVVMILNTKHGRANTGDPIHLPLSADAAVLDHELGHRLVGLGDEYTDTELAFTPRERFVYPPGVERGFHSWQRLDERWPAMPANLTTDPDDPPWRHLVDGAVEGGARAATGIWHPTAACAMNRTEQPFCAVCSNAIEQYLTWLDSTDDGPPRCWLESYTSLSPLSWRRAFVGANCSDRDGLKELEWGLDGRTVWSAAPLLGFEPDAPHRSVNAQLYLSLDELPPNHAGQVLAPGRHVFTLHARDAVGRTTELEWAFESVP